MRVFAVRRIHSSTPFRTLTFFLTTRSSGRSAGMDAELRHGLPVEVALLGPVCRPVDDGRWVDPPGADEGRPFLSHRYADLADEPFVQTDLGLASQIVVEPGKDDNDLVAGVGRLADQTCVVAGLARLDVADHHSAAVERTVALRIAEEVESPVGDAVERIDCLLRKLGAE